MRSRWSALAILVPLAQWLPAAVAQKSDYMDMSFFFDWNPQGSTFPVPVTSQCETIHIVWSRGTATGPNPVPPYYLQVYTSLFLVPIIIPAGDGLSYVSTHAMHLLRLSDTPGTVGLGRTVPTRNYIPNMHGKFLSSLRTARSLSILQFDSNGNTGGCQDKYTVIPAEGTASCANATIPSQLDVEGIVHNGPISRYGWIEQCTDIEIRPKNGTPPYTFTIAPALHPPFNMSGPGPFNWTVDLSWATPFFISVADSAGNAWSHGVLHSGGPGVTSACLAGNSTIKCGTYSLLVLFCSNRRDRAGISPGAAAGAGVGGIFLGLFIGLASMFLLTRKKIKTLEQQALLDLSGDAYGSGSYPSLYNSGPTQYHAVPSHGVDSMGSNQRRTPLRGSFQYHIEPFTMPNSTSGEDGRLGPQSPPTGAGSLTPNRRNAEGKVYVVHHDSQAPPVTIYHEDGTEVVELPPRYPDGAAPPHASRSPSDGGSGSGSGGRGGYEGRSDITALSGTTRTSETEVPQFLQQPRRPNQPGKPPRNRSPHS
ncbi:hypothetical protein NMY22_g939 [Coprinellus aureogranulatus]|nr:hypothetical protein NMY22_g939 [Coprinellus aureogranulatus]